MKPEQETNILMHQRAGKKALPQQIPKVKVITPKVIAMNILPEQDF